MPLAPSFTAAATSTLGHLLITDTSTGSDVAITDRTITIYNAANAVIFTIDFPLSDGSTIDISPFTTDQSCQIIINWLNNVGVSIYNFAILIAYTQYAESYYYTLTQQQQANPAFLNDQQYFQNKSKLRTLIDSATQAITVGQDVVSANVAIALYQTMLNSPNLYF